MISEDRAKTDDIIDNVEVENIPFKEMERARHYNFEIKIIKMRILSHYIRAKK